MNINLIYRGVTGAIKGKAIARNVRLTPATYVIDPGMVEITEGKVRFGFTKRYMRDGLRQYPKPNPLSGNGRWCIESIEE